MSPTQTQQHTGQTQKYEPSPTPAGKKFASTPAGKFAEMITTHVEEGRTLANRLETCVGDLAKSTDQITLTCLPVLRTILTKMRDDEATVMNHWLQFEKNLDDKI